MTNKNVMRKKISLITAALTLTALCATQTSFGVYHYTHSIHNMTDKTAVIHVNYAGCKGNDLYITPNDTQNINAGVCILQNITALMMNGGGLFATPGPQATPYNGPYTGSGNWAIMSQSPGSYGVVRLAQ